MHNASCRTFEAVIRGIRMCRLHDLSQVVEFHGSTGLMNPDPMRSATVWGDMYWIPIPG